MEITNLCNRNCTFCPGTVREPKMMSVPEFEQIAQKLTGITGYLYYHLMGEPLTHPGLPQMLAIAEKLGSGEQKNARCQTGCRRKFQTLCQKPHSKSGKKRTQRTG